MLRTSAKYLVFLLLYTFSFQANANVTATNNQYFSNITVTYCGGNVWKVKAWQSNQWAQGRLNIRYNGTLIGKSCWNCYGWSTNQQYTANNDGSWAIGGHSGRWVYVKVEANSQKAYAYFSDFPCSSCTTPTVGTVTGGSRCGTGTVQIKADVSAGSVKWYTASSGGTLVGTSGDNAWFTTPSISSTKTYYAEAINGSCVSSSRKAVTASVTPNPTLGSLNKNAVNFCASNGNFGSAATVSGQTGTVIWDWGSNNGSWNNNWVTSNNSATCCFPKKISNNDARPDRIRYRVINGSCPSVTSGTILVKNCYNEAPSSLAASSTSICSGTQITLTATFPNAVNMNGKVEFATSLNGSAFTTITPSANQSVFTTNVTPSANTTYYVRYSGIASGGGTCYSASKSIGITVAVAPSAGTLSGGQQICIGNTTTFSSTVSGGTWSSNNTGIASINSATGVVTGIAAGTATITYTKTGSGGCANATATRTVTVTAPSSAGTLSGVQQICVGNTTTFSSSVSGGSWSSNNSGIASINSATGVISGVSAGTATITYTIAGSGGCSNATATRTVTVNTPTLAGTLSGDQEICVGSTTTFSSAVSGGSWSSNNTSIATINSTTGVISGVSAGTATITYTKTGSGGCSSATSTRTVTVNGTPTILSVTNGERCNSGTVDLSVTASSGTINWYSLPTGGSTLGTGISFTTPSLSSTTTYYVDASNGSCVSSPRTAVTATINSATAGPGGVTDELLVWLKADDANLGATWQDHSCNGFDYTTVNGPTMIDNVWNDNPAIEILSGGFDAPEGAELGTDWTVFFVAAYKQGGSQGRLIDGHTGNYLLGFHGGYRNGVYWNGASAGELNNGIATATGATDPHIYTYKRSNSNGSLKVRIDGDSLKTFNSTNSGAGIRLDINQGNYRNESSQARIGEFIIFNKALNNTEIQKVETYLATKYGVSASSNDGGNGGDYISSNGTTYWDASAGADYHNDVVVIGKDNGSLAIQKQAKSYNDSVKVFVAGLASNNLNNAGNITNDNAFIAIGHNKGKLKATAASNAEKPAEVESRIEREWKITNTNFTNDFSIEIEWDSTGNVNLNHLLLLVDDDGDFSDANYYSSSNGLTFSFGSIIVSGINSSFIESGSTKYITLGSSDQGTPLPVELLSFNAEPMGEWIFLSWETAIEINNAFFILEKSSDAVTWKKIAQIDGTGNSTEPQYYSHLDKEECYSTCYYRLTQVDFDGTSKTFDIISIYGQSAPKDRMEINVYPNPFCDKLNISYRVMEDGIYDLVIYNSLGTKVLSSKAIGIKGENTAELNVFDLPSGNYIVVLSDQNGTTAKLKISKTCN